MFPLPTKGSGSLHVAPGRSVQCLDGKRGAGAEVPEAWDWPLLGSLLRIGDLVFTPSPPYDLTLPAQVTALLTTAQLRTLCTDRGLDGDGSKGELTTRLLMAAGYLAKPIPVVVPPAPVKAQPAPAPAPDMLDAMSHDDVRAIAPAYGVTPGGTTETREDLVRRVRTALGGSSSGPTIPAMRSTGLGDGIPRIEGGLAVT